MANTADDAKIPVTNARKVGRAVGRAIAITFWAVTSLFAILWLTALPIIGLLGLARSLP